MTEELKPVQIECDRCHKQIEGMESAGATVGFYRVTAALWTKYANPGETLVCDECIHQDERYLADHPALGAG